MMVDVEHELYSKYCGHCIQRKMFLLKGKLNDGCGPYHRWGNHS